MSFSRFSQDLGFIEGPVWDRDTATLSVVSIDRGCVYILDSGGDVMEAVPTGGGPNGMVLSERGLLVAQNGGIFGASQRATPGVQEISQGAASYLLEGRFAAPNDLAFAPDGRLFVTDPQAERAVIEPVEGCVYACDIATGRHEVVIAGRMCPNGLAFTAQGDLLLAQTQARVIERFRIDDAAVVSEGIFCHLANGRPDGLAIDAAGRVWACTPGTGGIEVYSDAGDFIRRIEIGADSMTTNLCFGGPDGCTLFVTAARWGEVIALQVDVPGLALNRGPAR